MRGAFCGLCLLAFAPMAQAQPMVSDTRIKTLVYNANDVYAIVTNYGYQSNIEFSKNEKIRTISVGDLTSWQVIPAESNLFVRALMDDAHTNMTVITNKRTYQFDLFAKPIDHIRDEELAYVIRFYYPEEYTGMQGGLSRSAAPTLPSASSSDASFPTAITTPQGYNFNYTIAGPDHLAPMKIYDDGQSTYFQFHTAGLQPQVFRVDPITGQEIPLQAQMQGNLITVFGAGTNFSIRQGNDVVCVFNESRRGGY
jgi:type IV secretion system protein VirB9